ncbi:TetR/AcrR family transcriptional regulator [Niabella aurantiaca]|uniref:TetR/AcrR family transcriptional regulator n=1 Tax=Niabella aurantiaca TaxID=379900 RepID=UPI000378E7E2|nr:TetR/AcrR family transcriptional regulator [Niabella aurantiaca]
MARRVHQGSVYNKERTKKKLIDAVGRILIREGFQNIKVNKIAAVSGLSKKLIYNYFGGLEGLIKAYLEQVDFWKIEEQKLDNGGKSALPEISKDFMFQLLRDDFEYLYESAEMQKIVLWGISVKNKTLRELSDEREELGKRVFEKADAFFENSQVDFRATVAILVSSIYYMVLHAKTSGSRMCGIDVSTKEGKERVLKALERLIGQTYKYAGYAL